MTDASPSSGAAAKPRFKPLVIFVAPPSSAHTDPLLPYAAHLQKKGCTVIFLAGAQSKEAVMRTGADHLEIPNSSPSDDAPTGDAAACPPGHSPFLWELRRQFLDGKAEWVRRLEILVSMMHTSFNWKEIVLVEEMMFTGSWHFLLGAPLPELLPRLPKVISFSTGPLWVSSRDTAPFGDGILPERTGTDEGRARNVALYQEKESDHEDLAARANEVFASVGATGKIELSRTGDGIQKTMLDAWATKHEILVQPCSPSLEYPRSDLPSNIRFIGAAPTPVLDASTALPSWWGELEANKRAVDSKKVVVVAQDTAATDNYDHLIKPALTGLENRDDLLVVAILGKEGATLDDFNVPRNARIQDNLPYHAVLPYADIFVCNGGYGDFIQAVMNGVPMVLAGTTHNEAEVAARGEWAGIAVNLRTDTPTAGAIRTGVDKVLGDVEFKARAEKIRGENEEMDSLVQLERLVMEAAVDSEKLRPLTGWYGELVASKAAADGTGSVQQSKRGSSEVGG